MPGPTKAIGFVATDSTTPFQEKQSPGTSIRRPKITGPRLSRLSVRKWYFIASFFPVIPFGSIHSFTLCSAPPFPSSSFPPNHLLYSPLSVNKKNLRAISVALNLASVILVSFFPIAGEIDLLPLRGRKVRVISTALLITSLFTIPLTFSAALWQHTTAATASPLVRYLSSGALSCTVGSTATTLAWLSFGASFVSGTMSIRAMFMFFRHPPDSEDANPTLARENRVDAWLSER